MSSLLVVNRNTDFEARSAFTGVDINTHMKLLVRAGEKCERVMGRLIVNVPVKGVECDEIWAYVY